MIDVRLFGVEGLSCSYVVDAAEPALIETGPTTVLGAVVEGLEALKIAPKHVVLSHIHLDHAGGAGHVCALFPEATVWVHEVGAKHMIDPARLVASATRIYGEAMDTLWGPVQPVPEARLQAIGDGDVIALGDRELRVLYTPGHASHEVTLYEPDTGAAFVGDTAGVCLGADWQKPATPPPDFDLEAALDSIERVKGLKANAICFTHYGPAREPALDQAATDLRRWDAVLRPMVLREAGVEEMVAELRKLHRPLKARDDYDRAADELSSFEASLGGYVRYYRQRLGG